MGNINKDIELLESILRKNYKLMAILDVLEKDELENYYVTAGAISQSIFNYYHGYNMLYGISDYDIIYFDSDTSYLKEDEVIKRISSKLEYLDVSVDIKNQARVHMWYYEKYKVKKEPYSSVEDAVASFCTTISCIGVRLENSKLVVCAPYGLDDIFRMIIRPIKKNTYKEIYDYKACSWLRKWNKLKKIEWV